MFLLKADFFVFCFYFHSFHPASVKYIEETLKVTRPFSVVSRGRVYLFVNVTLSFVVRNTHWYSEIAFSTAVRTKKKEKLEAASKSVPSSMDIHQLSSRKRKKYIRKFQFPECPLEDGWKNTRHWNILDSSSRNKNCFCFLTCGEGWGSNTKVCSKPLDRPPED